jgi:Family of unknown function (DUF5367)
VDNTLDVCEYEFVFIFKETLMNRPLLFYGLAIWIAATIFLRIAGQHVLHPDHWSGILILFAISFPLMAWLARRLCRRFKLPAEQWPGGAVALCLPTLLLDPFSSAFFPLVFPNMAPQVAGAFGGWMLCCCAGALVGATIGRERRA